MPITYEKIESMFEEKLEKSLQPFTKKLEEVTKAIQFTSNKYDEIIKLLKINEEEKKELLAENKSLRAELLQSKNEVKMLKESVNDLEQYLRRDCVEICGIPLNNDQEDTNNIVIKVAEVIGVDIAPTDISVSHRLPKRAARGRSESNQNIIVKFVRRDVKEKFYHSRKNLKNVTAADLGYLKPNKIFINESLSQRNKELFGVCLKFKKDHGYKYIWTQSGNIYMRKDGDNPRVRIKDSKDLQGL